MPDFTSILDRPATEIEKPKPYPIGTYLCVVKGQPKIDKVGDNKTEVRDFSLTILQPGADVDLSTYGKEIQGKELRARFFVTEDAIWRLKDFLVEKLGLDAEGKSLNQLCAEAQSHQVMVEVTHQPSKDGTEIYSQIKSYAKV